MMYKIILNKVEITIDEEDKQKIINNIDKSFILLKSGEVLNPSFVQGIVIDRDASRYENRDRLGTGNVPRIESPRGEVTPIKDLLDKYKPDFKN